MLTSGTHNRRNYSAFFIVHVYTIYKYGCGPHNANGWARCSPRDADWKAMLYRICIQRITHINKTKQLRQHLIHSKKYKTYATGKQATSTLRNALFWTFASILFSQVYVSETPAQCPHYHVVDGLTYIYHFWKPSTPPPRVWPFQSKQLCFHY